MRITARFLTVPVAALLLLAGCAPDPLPADTTPPVAVPTPTPTPTVSQPTEPVSILPLGCADLVQLSAVQDGVPGGPIEISVDETSVPKGWNWAGFVTAGGLRCVWGGTDRTDGGYGQGFQVNVLADAEAEYDRWAGDTGLSVAWETDTYGDRSLTYCSKDYQNGCYGGMLVDGYWVDVSLRDYVERSKTVANQRLGELIEPIVAAIRSAGAPNPAWTPPAGSYDGAELCADGEVATAVVGKKAKVSAVAYPEQNAIDFAGIDRAGLVMCDWTSSAAGLQDVGIIVFPGGAWMFPRMLAEPDEAAPSYLSSVEPIDIEGADGTVTAHADEAWAAMSIGGSLIMVSDGSTYEVADLVPALKRLAAHVAGV